MIRRQEEVAILFVCQWQQLQSLGSSSAAEALVLVVPAASVECKRMGSE